MLRARVRFPSPAPPFATAIIRWQQKHGRHNLPWQNTTDPYLIWLSEVMLQQTQVATVIPYYQKFTNRFPTISHLARARQDTVLSYWSGLGYYARAHNLHQTAKHIHKNGFPNNHDEWQALAGIGRSTAAAIMVFSKGQRAAILDGNVKRILARVHTLNQPTNQATDILWDIAEKHLPPKRNIKPYTQGLMDLGATLCHRKNPNCTQCPINHLCQAHQTKQTDQYPRPKTQKDKPTKPIYLLLIKHDNRVLLQKRPNTGIWRGLWSLPENADKKTLQHEWQEKLNHPLKPRQKTHIKHSFTHYHLSATVLQCDCPPTQQPQQQTPPPNTRWFTQADLNSVGLPAPIQRLLLKQ